MPSAKAKALGSAVEIDVTRLAPSELGAYQYCGNTMLVLRRYVAAGRLVVGEAPPVS